MCNPACIDFFKKNLKEEYIKEKSIIEVGSMDINGSLRSIVELFRPSEYVGVDIQMGPGVDQLYRAEDLIIKFGSNRFDMLICTELLEHVEDWVKVIHNLKQIIKPEGVLCISTRSKGFRYHGYPFDFWRYEISDMRYIFSDFDIKLLENDSYPPGIFILATKPQNFIENEPANSNLYSIILGMRVPIKISIKYWKIMKVLIKMLGIKKSVGYFIELIPYYIKHPITLPKVIRKLIVSNVREHFG